MLTAEEFKTLEERCRKGKAYIESHGGWSGGTTPPFNYERDKPTNVLQRSIVTWFKLSKELFNEQKLRGLFDTTKVPHSKVWLQLKQQEALEKWKHTLKAKRGPDPRTLSLESFA